MKLKAVNGVVVDADESAVKRLMDNGFVLAEEPKPQPKRRAPRKAQKPQEKK